MRQTDAKRRFFWEVRPLGWVRLIMKQKSCSTVGDAFAPLKVLAWVLLTGVVTPLSIGLTCLSRPRRSVSSKEESISSFSNRRPPIRMTSLALSARSGATPTQDSVRNAQ